MLLRKNIICKRTYFAQENRIILVWGKEIQDWVEKITSKRQRLEVTVILEAFNLTWVL